MSRSRLAISMPVSMLLVALGTGCSTTSSGQSSNGSDTQIAAPVEGSLAVDHAGWSNMGYRWEWTSTPPTARGATLQFVDAEDDVLIVQDTDATLSVIESNTGKVRWSKQVAKTNTKFYGNVREGDVVFCAHETELWEFDLQSGNTLDRTPLGTIGTTKPVLFGKTAIMGGSSGRLIAVDLFNNIRLWNYDFDGLIETTPIKIDNNRVAAISTKGDFRVLDAATARTISEGRISGDSGADMVTDGFALFIASEDQSVYGYEVDDGYRTFRIRSSDPVRVQPTLDGERLFITTRDTGLASVDIFSGEIVWQNPAIGGWVLTIDDGDLMVWTGYELIRVDRERGDVISRLELDSIRGLRSDAAENGNIYLIDGSGRIAKLSPR